MKYIDSRSHIGYGMYKNVSELKLTNEIQYFARLCSEENSYLMIKIPDICIVSSKLQEAIESLVDDKGQSRIRILRQRA
ncbi:hypothetical protein GCM10007418_34630 [Halopseudomonas salina]|uniref:Uncharacterized protein n=1 Tax=Halopseudomonas salina TaxID=1323744 RepID=A0ABQ1Q514_9GAMM|nr:hypothetical protein GCM10007418_34630 [Halopseudomonas salina]